MLKLPKVVGKEEAKFWTTAYLPELQLREHCLRRQDRRPPDEEGGRGDTGRESITNIYWVPAAAFPCARSDLAASLAIL